MERQMWADNSSVPSGQKRKTLKRDRTSMRVHVWVAASSLNDEKGIWRQPADPVVRLHQRFANIAILKVWTTSKVNLAKAAVSHMVSTSHYSNNKHKKNPKYIILKIVLQSMNANSFKKTFFFLSTKCEQKELLSHIYSKQLNRII